MLPPHDVISASLNEGDRKTHGTRSWNDFFYVHLMYTFFHTPRKILLPEVVSNLLREDLIFF